MKPAEVKAVENASNETKKVSTAKPAEVKPVEVKTADESQADAEKVAETNIEALEKALAEAKRLAAGFHKNATESVNGTSSVFNSLSELATSGLKVGEKLEVSSVDANTNTIVLSVKSENATSQVAASSTPEPSREPVKVVAVAAANPKPSGVVAKESHPLIPLMPHIASNMDHFSGAASSVNTPKFEKAVEEPHSGTLSKAVKLEHAKEVVERPKNVPGNHWSGSSSELNPSQFAGPSAEPSKHAREPGHKAAMPSALASDHAHWSGSASELGGSQFFGPKPEGESGQGHVNKGGSRNKAAEAAAYAQPVPVPPGFDKVPYIWDSLMQGGRAGYSWLSNRMFLIKNQKPFLFKISTFRIWLIFNSFLIFSEFHNVFRVLVRFNQSIYYVLLHFCVC